MNLFKNRPFAIFCLIFIISSVLSGFIGGTGKLAAATVFLLLAVLCAILYRIIKRYRLKFIFALICCSSVILALVSQYLSADMRREKQQSYEGERIVKMLVVEEGYLSDYSSEYEVEIKEIDGERISARSIAVCAFADELDAGDLVYARCAVYSSGEKILGYARSVDSDVYIQTAIYNTSDVAIISENNGSFRIFCANIRRVASETIDGIFGEELSPIVKGFILGDKSALSSDVIREFRRAGVSHLLAVSGLHISVIMGVLEFLLRKACTPKSARCILLSAAALVFLAMTGFAMSAARSVIMLLLVYFCYLFVKENDAVTSLFASAALIMLLSPTAVSDVGLWLSFLATLGILSVYAPLSVRFKARRGKGMRAFLLGVLKKILLAFFMTFICNVFICAVVWICFGEISAVSLISNPILTPLSEIFVIAVFVAASVSWIPILSTLAVKAVLAFCNLITYLCELFSDIEGAVVSLGYSFAGVIILLMSAALAVMLTVKLKRKSVILIVPLAAALSFTACLAVYGAIHKGEVKTSYFSDGDNEMIVLTEGYSAAVCDFSAGAYSFVKNASEIASENNATEISGYVITHYHSYHVSSLEKLCRGNVVRTLYLPYPASSAELDLMKRITSCASSAGTDIYVYREGEKLDLLGGAWLTVIYGEGGAAHRSVSAVVGNSEEILTYVSAGSFPDAIENITAKSDYILFGKHAGVYDGASYPIDDDRLKCLFYADTEVYRSLNIPSVNAVVCIPPDEEKSALFELVLN
ncbi:MAG: ComEC/Rec2 family competence protein [Clostridia bacterium]|nr:ComEC/Rec2 family competence protein [Clostridia bacterium]